MSQTLLIKNRKSSTATLSLLLFASMLLVPLRGQEAAPAMTQAGSDFKRDSSTRLIDKETQRILETPPADNNGWSFVFEPYLWGLGMDGHVGVKGFGPLKVDFSPKSILYHLDWGVMARGEIRKGRWGLIGDGFFSKLSADGNPPAPLYREADLKIYQGMASLALFYRVIEKPQGFLDIYAGARFNYMDFNFSGDLDSQGIQRVSDAVVQRISNEVGNRLEEYWAANSAVITSKIMARAESFVSEESLAAMANGVQEIRDSSTSAKITRIVRELKKYSGSYREFIAASVEVREAKAKYQINQATQQQVDQAQQKLAKTKAKLSKELAKKIEKELPTSAEGNRSWVDPIIGLRGQINITRALYLAAQGDVGGFGAGSDIAWMVQATIGVNLTRHIFVETGYRYFYMDYASDGFIYRAAEAGVFLGAGVRF
ncbi:MAG: hypothetical protein ACK5LK_01860 [Chthoniobacterales bacterium]